MWLIFIQLFQLIDIGFFVFTCCCVPFLLFICYIGGDAWSEISFLSFSAFLQIKPSLLINGSLFLIASFKVFTIIRINIMIIFPKKTPLLLGRKFKIMGFNFLFRYGPS